jgi:uncharacterized protein (DUF433 family)
MNERIVVNPNIYGGKPCIKGTRIAVYMILELLENGVSFEEIIRDYYPHVTKEDIRACLEYARAVVEKGKVESRPPMTLEAAYGAVKPLRQPADLEEQIQIAQEEHAQAAGKEVE